MMCFGASRRVAMGRGRIDGMTDGSAPHLRDLVLLRRVRDRMDREYAQPLDVEALAGGVYMSAGHLSREFKRAYGESPYSYLMTRRVARALAPPPPRPLRVTEVRFAGRRSPPGALSPRIPQPARGAPRPHPPQ